MCPFSRRSLSHPPFKGGCDLTNDAFWPEGDTCLPAELHGQTTFDEPRAEPPFLWRRYGRTAKLAPFNMQMPNARHLFDAPTDCHSSGIHRQGAILNCV